VFEDGSPEESKNFAAIDATKVDLQQALARVVSRHPPVRALRL